MIPAQTLHILFGAVVALLYGGAVLAIGMLPLVGLLSRQGRTAIQARVGLFGFMWLGLVTGQGILGMVWLALALAGILYPWLVWIICALGWFLGCVMLLILRRQAVQIRRIIWSGLLACRRRRSWYVCVVIGIGTVGLLQGITALMPTEVDDALHKYLVTAKIIAASGTLEFQPFVHHFHGLLPLQVEMHWAALFAMANETAVTLWDYLCAVSFLSGIGVLTWSLTSSRRVVVLAVLMMLSTPAFFEMMGGGKADNAAAQYGMAAFVWLVLWPGVGHWAIISAGLCAGWAMASRYTNVVVLPAIIVFAIMRVYCTWRSYQVDTVVKQLKFSWISSSLLFSIAAGVAVVPMLIKNWLLVGCPLAPQFGCQKTFWATIYKAHHSNLQNISVGDFLLYPFVWTFSQRADMLGNISPLFIGFFAFLFLSYRHLIQPIVITGAVGLISLATWLLIEPFVLFTRWLLIPLGLLAVPLGASLVATEHALHHTRIARYLMRSTVLLVLLFLLFQSRDVVYAIRYIASIDSRAMRYGSVPHFGYDVAAWLNAHVQPGQRVALKDYKGHLYFVNSDILLNSESGEELQWLWEHRASLLSSFYIASEDFWRFYAQRGFTYIIVAKDHIDDGKSVASHPVGLQVAFVGHQNAVLRIEKP